MNRRRFLAVAGAGVATSTAGCLGVLGGGGDSTDDGGDSMDDDGSMENGSDGDGSMDDSSGEGSLADHAAVAGIEDQPRLGDLDGHVVVAFEDPSCPRCAAFEERVVPQIRENLVEPGKAAFVFRNYPVVYPWGEPASHALEATFDRDGDAFWSLLEHYVGAQSSFSSENVLDRTATFLDQETDVDGSAVVSDVESDAYADAIDADLGAGQEAGAGRVTPTVFLFRDGEFVTSASGSVSYEVIARALGEA